MELRDIRRRLIMGSYINIGLIAQETCIKKSVMFF